MSITLDLWSVDLDIVHIMTWLVLTIDGCKRRIAVEKCSTETDFIYKEFLHSKGV